MTFFVMFFVMILGFSLAGMFLLGSNLSQFSALAPEGNTWHARQCGAQHPHSG